MNHPKRNRNNKAPAAGVSLGLLRFNRRLAPTAILIALGLLFTSESPAFGEMVWTYDRENELRTVQLTVTPADEPRPALRHRLTLRPQDLRPGNSVAHYMRAYPEKGFSYVMDYLRKEHGEAFDEWYDEEFPLKDLPKEAHEAARKISNTIQKFLDPASHCRDCDWGYNLADWRGEEMVRFLLPEVQAMREMARALGLHARVAIAEHRYDDAINSLRISYRMGQDLGQQEVLVSNLVGIAITGIANKKVTELIAAPDSPNLYWALSELPNPPISIRESIRLEMAIGPRLFPFLDDPAEAEHTPEEWNALWMRQGSGFFAFNWNTWEKQSQPSWSDGLPLLSGLNGYGHAKQRLIDWGRTSEEVERMAVGQVLALYSARVYQIAADEAEKLFYTPFSRGSSSGYLEQIGIFTDHPDRELLPVAQHLLTSSRAYMSAEVRVARELTALRVIEALRMHAAQNDGRLPRSLDAVTCVPVPLNPATEKPFRYHCEGRMAVLELPDWEGFPGWSVRYEITIADK